MKKIIVALDGLQVFSTALQYAVPIAGRGIVSRRIRRSMADLLTQEIKMSLFIARNK